MILGLTGGPGTGKSLAAEYLMKRGAIILSGDDAGRRAIEKYPEVLKRLTNSFGSGILYSDGTLNRQMLGKIVFGDQSALKALNSIVHPQLLKILKNDLQKYSAKRKQMIVIDAALIYEWGIAKWCDYILVVSASRALRIKRLTKRGLTRTEAADRIGSQIPDREKKRLADFVINNNGTKADLKKQINKLASKLEALVR